MTVAVRFGDDFVRRDVDEDAARQGQHERQGGGCQCGQEAAQEGTERHRQAARRDDQQPAPRRHARLAQGRAHDDALANVLDAHRDDQQPTQPGAVPGGKTSADRQALGNAVDAQGPDDGVAATQVLGGLDGMVVIEADVVVMAAGMAVRDEAIHERGDDDPGQEPHDHLAEPKTVEAARALHAFQSLGQKPKRRCGEHEPGAEPEDAVIGSSWKPTQEEEGECTEAGGQASQTRGDERFQHARVVSYHAASAAEDFAYAPCVMVAYLALGSNLGDRLAHLTAAVQALAGIGRLVCSAVYETRPEGGAAQPDYLNAVVRIETRCSPRELLDACLAIERGQGRVRPAGVAKAARSLDIDVLLCDEQIVDEPGLMVPHPRLTMRPFVRIPLAEVALPDLRHPITGELLGQAPSDPTVRNLGPLAPVQAPV